MICGTARPGRTNEYKVAGACVDIYARRLIDISALTETSSMILVNLKSLLKPQYSLKCTFVNHNRDT